MQKHVTAWAIPTFALYGEAEDGLGTDWLYCQTIQACNQLHGHHIQPHRHEMLFQMMHISEGHARVTLDGVTALVQSPCMVMQPPMVVHEFICSPDVSGMLVTFFDRHLASVLRAAPEVARTFAEPRVIPLDPDRPESAMAASLLQQIASEWTANAVSRLAAIEALLAMLLITLHRLPGLASKCKAPDRAVAHAMRFRELVDQHFHEQRTVRHYADRLGMTPAHLNRLCQQALGGTALSVINRRVVLEAKRFLIFTAMSAQDIALELKFDDPAYFTRFFRREVGMPPLAFRAAQQGRG